MPGLDVGRLRAHEMAEFECDGLVVAGTAGGFEFKTQFLELDGEELDWHVAVERFGVGPALHSVAVGEFFVHFEEGIELVVVDVSVLEGACIDHVVYAAEYFVPFFFVLLHAHSIVFCER